MNCRSLPIRVNTGEDGVFHYSPLLYSLFPSSSTMLVGPVEIGRRVPDLVPDWSGTNSNAPAEGLRSLSHSFIPPRMRAITHVGPIALRTLTAIPPCSSRGGAAAASATLAHTHTFTFIFSHSYSHSSHLYHLVCLLYRHPSISSGRLCPHSRPRILISFLSLPPSFVCAGRSCRGVNLHISLNSHSSRYTIIRFQLSNSVVIVFNIRPSPSSNFLLDVGRTG